MANITEQFIDNHNALTAATKGAAPGIHIMWVACLLTIFETIHSWVIPQTPKLLSNMQHYDRVRQTEPDADGWYLNSEGKVTNVHGP